MTDPEVEDPGSPKMSHKIAFLGEGIYRLYDYTVGKELLFQP